MNNQTNEAVLSDIDLNQVAGGSFMRLREWWSDMQFARGRPDNKDPANKYEEKGPAKPI